MRRVIALLILILGLAPGTWWRSELPPRVWDFDLRIVALKLPPRDELARNLGPFTLKGIWQLKSPRFRFGGFSTLLPPRGGTIVAISDMAQRLQFTLPDRPGKQAKFTKIYKAGAMMRYFSDIESATRDPVSGRVWMASEGRNAVARFGPGMRFEGLVMPAAIQGWGRNSGTEAMTRLPDGRFVLLREAFTGWFENEKHAALIFDGDPVDGAPSKSFAVSGPASFSPTDLARLPDGRLLVLFRRAVWPFPPRFAGRIAIGDPADIRKGKVWRLKEVARLTSTLPVDNFEGLTVEPRKDGRLNIWVISDDNTSPLQRTLLWKLVVDPADLPGRHSNARANSARQAAGSE